MTKPSLQEIQTAINNAGAKWVAGHTSLSQLSEEEQNRRLGLKVPEGERERIALSLAQGAAAPTAFVFARSRDWRNKDGQNWITDVKDQGGCGSCVAFGTVATFEAQARIQYNKPSWNLDLSEADLFFCGAGRKCQEGWWPTDALAYVKDKGISEESCFPYQAQDMDCTPCSDRANRLLKIGKWQEIIDVGQRKEWLDKQGPLVACIAVYRDFFNYKDGIYKHVSGDLAGYHAISCVGYNEDEKYWICKNSWGKDWGDRGFFKIAYGEADIDTRFAMYAVGDITGTLAPDGDGVEKEGWAKYAVVEQSFSDGQSTLWVYIEDKWYHQQLSESQLASISNALSASNSLQVIYKGERIEKIRNWKQFAQNEN